MMFIKIIINQKTWSAEGGSGASLEAIRPVGALGLVAWLGLPSRELMLGFTMVMSGCSSAGLNIKNI